MVFGTFDIVHMGHIHMFKQAKEYCDYLVVVVARNKNVEKIKGIGPLHSEEERKEFLENIKLIDEVSLGDEFDPYLRIKEVKPDIVAIGYDQQVFVDDLEEAITSFDLKSQIVRLGPYQKNRFKSGKIKKYIERVV